MVRQAGSGPLAGLRVVELAGLGPVPFAGMLLSDMGAEVLRIARPGAQGRPRDILLRGRTGVELDLKDPAHLALARQAAARADVLLEGMRPGVMERLGLGPAPLTAANPRLIYARMTGWGQDGPLAALPGHDINYIALAGALGLIGPPEGDPMVPQNLIGDYGGGGAYLAMAVLAAVVERAGSGRGQVIDCAIADNVLSLMTIFHAMAAAGSLTDARGGTPFSGTAPFYTTYRCKDGGHLAVGAGEPQFYATWRRLAGLTDPIFDRQRDRSLWPRQRARAAEVFATRTLAEWMQVYEGADTCVTPVLSVAQSLEHPHFIARGSVVEVEGARQSAPAPRFSRTPSAIGERRALTPEDLAGWWAE